MAPQQYYTATAPAASEAPCHFASYHPAAAMPVHSAAAASSWPALAAMPAPLQQSQPQQPVWYCWPVPHEQVVVGAVPTGWVQSSSSAPSGLPAADGFIAGAALSADAEPFVLEEQRSVASSNCSTAPSIRRRKPRAPLAERKALAAKQKQVEAQAQALLLRKEALTGQLEAGGEASLAAIGELQGAVWRLSTDVQGCRLVQLAVEKAKGAKRGEVVGELHGHVREAMGSPHANYVLQKVVEVMPIEIASFIAKELAGIAVDACKHRFGCRIMCRLTEQFASAPCVAKLLQELTKGIAELTTHSFGHHVVHAILEHGPEMLKHKIAMELLSDVRNAATNRSGSAVMERALMHCSASDVDMLVEALLAGDLVMDLMQSQFGIFVVKALTLQPGLPSAVVYARIESASDEARESKHFQRLQQILADEEEDDDIGEHEDAA